ncbi:MAG: group III truncated hemoglobin [Porphyromonadaceae bacterium]|jgi:hemoglobin|nr:group III truncated hemoglobin [Porphyromonadaceae bacterium]
MKNDIRTHEDIILLVDTFYGYVRKSPIIGFIFDEISKVDWSSHLPKMYDFWSSILLNEHKYRGNPMQVHLNLSTQTDMYQFQYNEWLTLFHKTIDELFEGEIADEAKVRSSYIAENMLFNIIEYNGLD